MMYSKWIKADLHIHTDKSKETKDGDYNGIFSVDDLFLKLKEHSIEMISLTDHNIINIEAYENMLKKDIFTFVGVELDVAISEEELVKYISNRESKNNEKIDIKPFHLLILFKSQDYVNLNNKLDKMYSNISEKEFKNAIDLKENKKIRTTTFKYIVETFKDEDFFIIAHGNKDKGIVSPYLKKKCLKEAQYNILMGGISALEMQSSITMETAINSYNSNFEKLLASNFILDSPTTYVVFSDNHEISEYGTQDYSTWFKGGLNFETLRLAFSDPESRVHTDKKEPLSNPLFIDGLKLKIKNNEVINNIKFSPNLNVIIGGRSSGKSLLFNSLVNLNNSLSIDEKGKFSDNYKELIDESENKIKLNIGEFEKTIELIGESYYQEKIIDIFKNQDDLKNSLINFFPKFEMDKLEEEAKKIANCFNEFCIVYGSYFDKQNLINKNSVVPYLKKSLENSKKLFNIDSDEIEIPYSIASFDDLANKIDKFKNDLNSIKNENFMSNSLFDENDIEKLNEVDNLLDNKLGIIKKEKLEMTKKETFFNKIKTINSNYINKELSTEKKEIETSKEILKNNLSDFRSYFLSKLKLRKQIEELEKIHIKISNKENKQNKHTFISKINFNINKDIIINDLFAEIINKYNRNKSLYTNILNLANIDNTETRIKKFPGTEGKKVGILRRKIDEFVKVINPTLEYEIVENGNAPISTDSTSQGRKASIFLDIKLNSFYTSKDKKLLLIDQIEDNIDNRYISETLVSLLRILKKEMQIIIVTHNPSIAIYGDAENIIIAENENGKISYTQGGLENEEIRKEACKILDGGDIAFKNRMDKYNILKVK